MDMYVTSFLFYHSAIAQELKKWQRENSIIVIISQQIRNVIKKRQIIGISITVQRNYGYHTPRSRGTGCVIRNYLWILNEIILLHF